MSNLYCHCCGQKLVETVVCKTCGTMNVAPKPVNRHPTGPHHEEFKVQAEALMMMHGDILSLIESHGAEFRRIIDDFARLYGTTPTANDLVWIASEKAGRDLRKEKP